MGANLNKIIFFSIIPLILSLGIAPALPFANAGMSEVVECREGQVLARNLQHGYLKCMEPSKADRFVELGLVELVIIDAMEEAVEETMEETVEETMEETMDLFVHKSNVDGFINEGDKVEFEVGEDQKGPNATNVKKLAEG